MANNAINPFGEIQPQRNAAMQSDSDKAIQEIQSALVIAKKFPRDARQAMDNIINACTRITLAESAVYSYNRGGMEVTGASIRLAESVALIWGNIIHGVRELSQEGSVSTVEAFAWDLETNVKQLKTFQVPHIRYSKSKGNTLLTDPRDIYERIANDGARRVRACILGVIPGDVIETALDQCKKTQSATADTSPEAIKKMCEKFALLNINEEMIQKRIGNRLEAIRPAQLLQLRRIYTSINDGMSKISDWFEVVPDVIIPNSDINSLIKGNINNIVEDKTPVQVEGQPLFTAPNIDGNSNDISMDDTSKSKLL